MQTHRGPGWLKRLSTILRRTTGKPQDSSVGEQGAILSSNEASSDTVPEEGEEKDTILATEEVSIESSLLRRRIRRSLALVGLDYYDLVMHDVNQESPMESLEVVLRMGDRTRIAVALKLAIDGACRHSQYHPGRSQWPKMREKLRPGMSDLNKENVSISGLDRCIMAVPPGLESPMPALIGKMSGSAGESSITSLRKELAGRLRRAKVSSCCVILQLHNEIVVIGPQAQEAHLLHFSEEQCAGHLGASDRRDEAELSMIVAKAEQELDRGKLDSTRRKVGALEMKPPPDGSRDLTQEFGDLFHCFRGSYLVRANHLWYIVPGFRWRRASKLVKKFSKSLRPTSIRIFMLNVSWKYVDADISVLSRIFWSGYLSLRKGTLLTGSESVVNALSRILPEGVANRIGYNAIATAAQEYLLSCPDIMLRVKGPKKCWIALYEEEERQKSSSARSRALYTIDYWASHCHLVRPGMLRFGFQDGDTFVRVANQRDLGWMRVTDMDHMSRVLCIGKRAPEISPVECPPESDYTWNNAWRVGDTSSHEQ